MDDIVNEVNYVEFLVVSHPRTVQSFSEEKFRNLCAIVRLMSVSKYPPLSRLTAERVSKHE
jgi:hypothetical protein